MSAFAILDADGHVTESQEQVSKYESEMFQDMRASKGTGAGLAAVSLRRTTASTARVSACDRAGCAAC